MTTLYRALFIFVIWAVMTSPLLAQELVPLKLEVGREVPNISFTATKFSLHYWLRTEEAFVAMIPDETIITTLEDDRGTDLKRSHEKAVEAWKLFVEQQAKKGRYKFTSRSEDLLPLDQAVALRDTIGFKFILDSWALPHSEATTVQLKGKLAYWVTDPDAKEQVLTTDCQGLGKGVEVDLLGEMIKISEAGSSSIGDERSITYNLDRAAVPVALSKVAVYNDKDELVTGSPFGSNSGYTISVKQEYSNQPVTLKFYYREMEKRELLLDQKIDLGL